MREQKKIKVPKNMALFVTHYVNGKPSMLAYDNWYRDYTHTYTHTPAMFDDGTQFTHINVDKMQKIRSRSK